MFAYCGNNPVNRIDPDGNAWKDVNNLFSNTWNNVKKTAKQIVETVKPIIDYTFIDGFIDCFVAWQMQKYSLSIQIDGFSSPFLPILYGVYCPSFIKEYFL